VSQPVAGWRAAVGNLVTAIREFLGRHLDILNQRPDKQPDAAAVSAALDECRRAAAAVGDEREQRRVSATLARIRHDAEDLANRVTTRPPAATWREWVAGGGTGKPHDITALRGECDHLAGRLAHRNIDHEIREAATPAPAPGGVPSRQYVTLDKAAAIVNRRKRTLEKHMKRPNNPLPQPDIRGCGGRPSEWEWPKLRMWLEAEYSRSLPPVFPDGSGIFS
jgi:hypothetical protein